MRQEEERAGERQPAHSVLVGLGEVGRIQKATEVLYCTRRIPRRCGV